jgi:ADP-ribose pyrophosphatase YjhB (NUDIX family)
MTFMNGINYCSNCGTPLETRLIDGTARKACPACPFVHWGTYSIGVGALLVHDGRMLLVRRAQDPGKGYWTNPGGYIEQHEPIQRSIEREVLEETGIVARAAGIAAVRDLPRDNHNVYIAFHMDFVEGEPRADGVETDAAGFYSLDEMREMNVAPFTRWLADVALNGRMPGLERDVEPVVPLPQAVLFRVL